MRTKPTDDTQAKVKKQVKVDEVTLFDSLPDTLDDEL